MLYCYQILFFSMSNYLNAYKQFVFTLTNSVLCLNSTGYQMKAYNID